MRLLLFLFFYSFLYGQTTPYAFYLNKVSGMPSDMVFDVFQDNRGFMWYATGKGICRFDGSQIKTYISADFPIKSVSNINQDFKGRIWFQDFNGTIFYIENGITKLFPHYKANGFLKFGFINNHLFIAGKEGIKIFRISDFKLIKTISLDMKSVIQSIASNDKFYLIGSQVYTITLSGTVEKVSLPDNFTAKIPAPIPISSKEGIILFSKFNDNYIEIGKKGYKVSQLPFNTTFTQNANIIGDDFWICSTKGIYRYNTKTKEYNLYYPSVNISFIIKTKSGKFWISTINNGMLYVDNWSSDFINTPSTPARLVKSGKDIYFTSNREEIYRLDKNQQPIQIYKGNSDHLITPLLVDSLNKKLLFTSSKFIIKSEKSQLESIFAVKHIVQLDAKYYVVSASTWNGIIYTDPNKKSEWDSVFEPLKHSENGGIHFITIIENENGKDCSANRKEKSLYFITNYGLKKFQNSVVKEITSKEVKNFTQLSNINNQLFLLSEDEKIYTLNDETIKLVEFPYYFSNSKIQRIKTNGNTIFIYKDQAIYNYSPSLKTVHKAINIPKELEVNDITAMGSYVYYATNKGIIKTPKLQNSLLSLVELHIDNILVNGENSVNTDLTDLKFNQNNIEINFSIISESPNNFYTISARIDKNPWEQISNTSRTLRFSSLSFGEHIIQLKIENGTQKIIKEFKLYIDPPIWLKWWFITLVVLVAFALGYFYFRKILKQNDEKNQKKLEQANLEKLLNQSKLKSLKSQMNPHFFFNALNTLQSYILSNDKKEAVSYLSKFSKLTRSILEMSDKDDVSVGEEIQTLTNYLELEKARFNGDFHYSIEVDEKLNPMDIFIPSLLLQPFVENAIKHGLLHKKTDKNLIIKFDDENEYLKISIDDDGIGRKKSAELNSIKNKDHKSFATQSLAERIDILNKNLNPKIRLEYTDKEPDLGTTVTLYLPKES
ncbi:sensor histidine kinase [Chryseobacterium oryctis]|uniref:Histidine kinase n=1 Tax=Chryseobacterium oryctis TaxID=2952618 RepID=A0ABT3HMJ8_9FLAO|nr:histidine kinase [Chryseobacterium oryctis]MCW3161015.1 histidine kinase [Chryseobacterium oryctis]